MGASAPQPPIADHPQPTAGTFWLFPVVGRNENVTYSNNRRSTMHNEVISRIENTLAQLHELRGHL